MTTHFEKMYINYGIQQTRWFLFLQHLQLYLVLREREKKYAQRGTLWAWRFHPAICQITPRENGIVFQNVFSQNLKLLDTLQKRVVRKDTVRFKPPSQRKCHIYFGYNNSHLRFRGFRKNKWMTFVVLSGWGFEANSDEL